MVKGGDVIDGQTVASSSSNIDFDYTFSGDNSHRIFGFFAAGAPTASDFRLAVDGTVVASEGGATGQGDNWQAIDVTSINNVGNYIFSGDTDGASGTDEFLAYNGAIGLREGDVVDGRTLGSSMNAASINNLDQVAFIWSSDLTETLFFGDGADLGNAVALLSVGDMLDTDGNGFGDVTVTDFNASNIIGPGLDLAEDGWVYVEVDIKDADGITVEAIIRVAVPAPGSLALLGLGGLAAIRRRR